MNYINLFSARSFKNKVFSHQYMSVYTEYLCLKEVGRVMMRNPKKYWPLIPAMYFGALKHPRTLALVRHGYAVARHVDDVLDGDLDVGKDPIAYARELKAKLGKEHTGYPRILKVFDYISFKG